VPRQHYLGATVRELNFGRKSFDPLSVPPHQVAVDPVALLIAETDPVVLYKTRERNVDQEGALPIGIEKLR
jgi:hypothetical protein